MVEFLLTLGLLSAGLASFYVNHYLYRKLEVEQRRVRRLERINVEQYLEFQQKKQGNNGQH